jgi:replicative DNA helicase
VTEATQGLLVPPHSVEAEEGVLGSILLDPVNSLLKAMEAGVCAESFYDRRHQALFSGLQAMLSANAPMDAITIGEWLKDRNELDRCGGYDYLVRLQADTLVPAHVDYYSKIVSEKRMYRAIIEVAQKMMDDAYCLERPARDLLQEFPARLARLMASDGSKTNAALLDAWVERMEKIKNGELQAGLPLPWVDLDKMMCGLQPGLIMLGARPSVGKTTLAVNVVDHLARQGYPGAWVPRDMGWEQTLVRSVIRESRVSLPRLNRGFARWSQIETVRECARLVKSWPLHAIEESSLQAILTQARMLKLKHDIQYLVIDFLTLLHVDGWRGERRTEIGRITGELKGLGLELGIPVILLSQLSRGSVKDGGRRPRMDDFRESGDIEQDATQAILLSKALPEDYNDFKPPKKGEEKESPLPVDADKRYLRGVIVDLAKNQQGETGWVEMWMRPNYFRMEEAEPGFCDLTARLSEFGADLKKDEACDPAEPCVVDGEEEVEVDL